MIIERTCFETLQRRMHSIGLISLLGVAGSFALFTATPVNAQQNGAAANSVQLPDGNGREIVSAKCGLCHTLDHAIAVRRTKADWQRVVALMWQRRAPISEDDIPTLVDYLYTNFGRPDFPPPTVKSAALPASYASYDFSKPAVRGTLTGTVTADQGQVHAFSVMAHNLLYRVRYMVYTKDGHYTVPQALPGPYEIYGAEYGYSSPTVKADLKPGDTATTNLAVTKDPPPTGVTMVDFDTVYPPGPGRDLYFGNCVGCHANSPHYKMQLSEYGFEKGVEYMRWGQILGGATGGATQFQDTQFSTADMNAIGHYLGSVLDPNVKRMMRRPDYPIDENLTSKAIFVVFDLPDEEVNSRGGNIGFHDSFAAVNGDAWYGSGAGGGVMIRLDPRVQDPNKRMTFYGPPSGATFSVNGIAEDMVRHHIYFADLSQGRLGEIDPATAKVSLHVLPSRGGIHSMYGDSKGNIWYANLYGQQIGKYDPTSGHAYTYPPSKTPDYGPYGVTEDHKGNIWIAGVTKGIISKFDTETQTMTEFKVPTLGAGPRRIRADSKDIMWFSESSMASIGRLDPQTGKFTEIKLPVPNITPYSVWTDRKDESIIWATDLLNDYGYSPFYYDTKTKKMNYYPGPPGTWAPETFTEPNNTVWLVQQKTATAGPGQIHFYPYGYTPDAPPAP